MQCVVNLTHKICTFVHLDHGEHILKYYYDKCSSLPNTSTSLLSSTGDAKHEALEFAEKSEIDMIVVGHRGLGALRRMIMGSFSNYILSHAKCDVLIVK
jgi:nucleotide-binding universal stress UspA family protein